MLRDTKEIVLCKDSSWYRRLIYFFLFKMSFVLYCSCSRCCNSSRSWQAIKQQWANEYVPREGHIYVYERVHTQDMGFMNERRNQGMISIWVDMNTPNREPTALMTIAPPHFIWKWNWLTDWLASVRSKWNVIKFHAWTICKLICMKQQQMAVFVVESRLAGDVRLENLSIVDSVGERTDRRWGWNTA